MTQEERELLLKDLCARLPYGVKVQCDKYPHPVTILYAGNINEVKFAETGGIEHINSIKPYLRPMSSMTDEEEILFRCELPTKAKTDAQLVAMRMELFLKGHLDYNHLIEKGLALEAPEDMYKED